MFLAGIRAPPRRGKTNCEVGQTENYTGSVRRLKVFRELIFTIMNLHDDAETMGNPGLVKLANGKAGAVTCDA